MEFGDHATLPHLHPPAAATRNLPKRLKRRFREFLDQQSLAE
jgi:hypothetical protein